MPLATALVTALKTRDAAVQATGCAQYLAAFESAAPSGRHSLEDAVLRASEVDAAPTGKHPLRNPAGGSENNSP